MKITVIGGGPGGYEAAIFAAKKGAEVVLIEKDKVGGTCLNRGCIPTKALLASYEVYETVEDSADFGIHVNGDVTVNYAEIIARKNKVTTSLVKGIAYLLEKNGVKKMDEDVAKQLARQFKKEKIKMITGDGIAEVIVNEENVTVKLQSGKELQAE